MSPSSGLLWRCPCLSRSWSCSFNVNVTGMRKFFSAGAGATPDDWQGAQGQLWWWLLTSQVWDLMFFFFFLSFLKTLVCRSAIVDLNVFLLKSMWCGGWWVGSEGLWKLKSRLFCVSLFCVSLRYLHVGPPWKRDAASQGDCRQWLEICNQ